MNRFAYLDNFERPPMIDDIEERVPVVGRRCRFNMEFIEKNTDVTFKVIFERVKNSKGTIMGVSGPFLSILFDDDPEKTPKNFPRTCIKVIPKEFGDYNHSLSQWMIGDQIVYRHQGSKKHGTISQHLVEYGTDEHYFRVEWYRGSSVLPGGVLSHE